MKISAMDSDSLQSYMQMIKKIPLLTATEEHDLGVQIQNGDKRAKQKLIESNLRLVLKVGRPFVSPGISLLDIIQEGNIGLINAVERFDPERKFRFSTYAVWWIRQSIQRYLSCKRRTIRLPVRKETSLHTIQNAYHILSQKFGRLPSYEEVAAMTDISAEEVELILSMSSSVLSLDGMDKQGSIDDSSSLQDSCEDYTYSPEREFFNKTSREDTMCFLRKRLRERERRVIICRFQLNGGDDPRTFRKIGEKMGISAEAVRQIELRALKKIRAASAELQDCVYA
jgi:RNA polymerase sigma factor (sigma-70 family)